MESGYLLQSMTGYGRASGEYDDRLVNVEIKSLNSKNLDLSLRLPSALREMEFELRKYLAERLIRGKVEVSIRVEHAQQQKDVFNQEKIRQYLEALAQIEPAAGVDTRLSIAMGMPEVLFKEDQEEQADRLEEMKSAIYGILDQALEAFVSFRKTEGEVLAKDVISSIDGISSEMKNISFYEPERLEKTKEKLNKALENFSQIDESRFYQEVAFYTEKLDISEEKTRLQQHLNYFLEVMQEGAPGKKLGFIAQEIGREINTIGSKANHAEIQKSVVMMKDYLERIKEQSLNIL